MDTAPDPAPPQAPDRPPPTAPQAPGLPKPPAEGPPAGPAPTEDTPTGPTPVDDVPPGAAPRPKLISPSAAAILGAVATLLLLAATGAFSSNDAPPPAAPPSATSTPTTTASRIADWYRNGGTTHADNIATDSRIIATASSGTSQVTLRTACIRMFKDVTAAQAYRPIPDYEAQKRWAAAPDLYRAGATDCANAASNNDTALRRQAAQAIRDAATETNAVTARIAQIIPVQ